MGSQLEALEDQVAEMLIGVNRYNPNNCATLEEYVDAQLAEPQGYDSDANLALLKLYQLNPDKQSWMQAVVKILLKALMALPYSDMTLCKSLIDSQNLDNKEVKMVCELAEVLEKCQFRLAWAKMEEPPLSEHLAPVSGFKQAIKKFACHTVNITYQTIRASVLKDLLGLDSDSELEAVCKEEGWKPQSDGLIYIANQEATVRNKNIQEKIELSDLKEILQVASGRQ